MSTAPVGLSPDDLRRVSTRLETRAPSEAIAWTLEQFGDSVAMACSFEDVALLHMVLEARPSMEVVFLDTGGHFAETLDFVSDLEREWSLNLRRTTPGPDAAEWPCGSQRCCELRKVEPLQRALAGRSAWITALKRVDAPSRAQTPVVEWDEKFGLVKVNPLATWTDDDVAYYLRDRSLPEHPLWAAGYGSIGCAPMTEKPKPGESRRSGRWVGLDKDECGLHEA
jgi:phosphoadenosine phosphosulfate reductase